MTASIIAREVQRCDYPEGASQRHLVCILLSEIIRVLCVSPAEPHTDVYALHCAARHHYRQLGTIHNAWYGMVLV